MAPQSQFGCAPEYDVHSQILTSATADWVDPGLES